MTTYAELKAQAEALLRQAEELRRQEIPSVIEGIKAQMREYGITIDDLGVRNHKSGRGTRSKKEPKYRGPNGELWSGGPGRKPDWVRKVLAAGGDLEQYRIS